MTTENFFLEHLDNMSEGFWTKPWLSEPSCGLMVEGLKEIDDTTFHALVHKFQGEAGWRTVFFLDFAAQRWGFAGCISEEIKALANGTIKFLSKDSAYQDYKRWMSEYYNFRSDHV